MAKKALLLVSCSIFLWASAFVVNRYLNAQMNPHAIICLRLVLAGIIMLPYIFMIKVKLSDFIDIALIGFTGIAGYSICVIFGQVTVDAGTTAFIVSQTPVFSVISAYLFSYQTVNRVVIGGMTLSCAGIALIYWSKNGGQFSFEPGILWILGACFAQSIYFVLQKRFLRKYKPIDVTALATVASGIPALLFLPFIQTGTVPIGNLALIGYLAIFPSIVAYFLWAKAIQNSSAIKVTNALYFLPFVTIFQSWIFLSEVPSAIEVVGGIISLIGASIAHKFNQETLKNSAVKIKQGQA